MSTIELTSTRSVSADYEALRARLERNLAERAEQLHQLSSTMSGDPMDVVADAHRASVVQILGDTEAALLRIDDRTYGRCESCGESIPMERLELVPHASSCVGCAVRWTRDR